MDEITIEDILASLDKETRGAVRLGREITKEVLPTASYSMNRAIGGGLQLGKQHTFWGGEGSGKTGFLTQTVGLNQKMGVPCAWIDSEGIFDPEWATKLGVDVDKFILAQTQTIPEATDLQIKFINSGVKLIVIDTTSELWPKSFTGKTGEVKNFDETGQLGQQAKDLGQMSKMVQGINYSCAIVHISQQRVDVGSAAQHKPYKPTGGKEIAHNDAIRVRLIGTKRDDKVIKEKVQRGNNLVEEVVGFPVDWIVQKNRLNGNEATGQYDFYKVRVPGVDYAGEILDAAVNYGFAEKGGAWYTIYGERAQGREKAVTLLRDNPELIQKLETELESV
jgi:recombination protein RecA